MKVSIVIPVYNAELFIEDCLRSVISQTMTDGIECILVDDCGADDSMQLADRFIEKNPSKIDFKILHQGFNQGPSAARNRGIREASGDFLFFLDSDDKISSDCMELLYSQAKEYDADYVQGTYSGETKGNILPEFSDDRRWIKRTLLNYNVIHFTPHNRLVRRQMILDHDLFFNESIRVREDFLWMTFIAKYVERFAYCEQPTYNRGYNEGSLTHNINREREILGYRVLIETMVANYDNFQLGYQKELTLDAFLMAFRAGYYHNEKEREHLIQAVKRKNSWMENVLFNIYFSIKEPSLKSKLLHMLIRLYKLND